MRKISFFGSLVLMFAVMVFSISANAAPGDLDATFGNNGQVISDYFRTEWANAISIQSDGKIIVVGAEDHLTGMYNNSLLNFLVARYNVDGTLDNNFGAGGKVQTNFVGYDEALAIMIQSDDKIVVAGSIGGDPAAGIARYNSDGTLDANFGNAGKVSFDFGDFHDEIDALAIQPDGKILVGGHGNPGGYGLDFLILARFNPDGKLDLNFGTGGKVTVGDGGKIDLKGYGARSIAFQRIVPVTHVAAAKDFILVGGYVVELAQGQFKGGRLIGDFALMRFNIDGTLDNTFQNGGIVTTDIVANEFDWGFDMVVQPDGKIVLGGNSGLDSKCKVSLARYNPNGSLDNGFGNQGVITTDLQDHGFRRSRAFGGHELGLQTNGKILVTGIAFDEHFLLIRYNADGTIDNGFGNNGFVETKFNGQDPLNEYAQPSALAVQCNGDIVVVGATPKRYWGFNPPGEHIAMARYRGDSIRCPGDFPLKAELPARIQPRLLPPPPPSPESIESTGTSTETVQPVQKGSAIVPLRKETTTTPVLQDSILVPTDGTLSR